MRDEKPIQKIIARESAALMKELGARKIATRYDWIATLCVIAFTLPVGSLAVLHFGGVAERSIVLDAAVALLVGIASGIPLYLMLGFVHDGAHGNIPQSSRLAKWLDVLTMPLVGVSSVTYRRAHLAHHAHLGKKDRDPQYAPFSQESNQSRQKNMLTHDGDVEILTPVGNLLAVLQEMGSIIQRREMFLFLSLFSSKAERALYRENSFTGKQREKTETKYVSLPKKDEQIQRRLDALRRLFQLSLFAGLLFDSTRWISVAVLVASTVAAGLNVLRASREHSGVENTGPTLSFNQFHSSNTAGNNLLTKLLWFPVPWHALHHAAPRIPFFELGNLQMRVLSSPELANELRA